MLIKPKGIGFICITAHPDGCEKNVNKQIEYVKKRGQFDGPGRVLVIGASTGFGLSSRIVNAFGANAKTIGVFFDRPALGNRTATAGWYNTSAFEKRAIKEGIYAKSINGDAFSNEIKQKTIDLIKEDLGQVDVVIYSLASPRRIHPVSGEVFNSVIKPTGDTYINKTVDFHSGKVTDVSIDSATEKEIKETIAVMGGEDWEMWINALINHDALAKGVITVAYSYIGPNLTHAIYKDGTIGRAKDDLAQSSKKIQEKLNCLNGKSFISVNKALVTQSSSAIPVVPLYISLLYKVMKDKNIHEGTIEQMYRLFKDKLYIDSIPVDQEGRIRIDDFEMRDDVQKEVADLWGRITSDNVEELSDLSGYREEFYKLFGFGFNSIDYEKDTDANRDIVNLI